MRLFSPKTPHDRSWRTLERDEIKELSYEISMNRKENSQHSHEIFVKTEGHCIYDDECDNLLHMCMNGRCTYSMKEGDPCREVTRYTSNGTKITLSTCHGEGLVCDPTISRCVTSLWRFLGPGQCHTDNDCSPTEYCQIATSFNSNENVKKFGTCQRAAYLDESCQVGPTSSSTNIENAPCMRPFFCQHGICKAPCNEDSDCSLGRMGKHRYFCDRSKLCQLTGGSCDVHVQNEQRVRYLLPPLNYSSQDKETALLVIPELPLLQLVDYRPMTLLFDDTRNSTMVYTRRPIDPVTFPEAPSNGQLGILEIILIALTVLFALLTLLYGFGKYSPTIQARLSRFRFWMKRHSLIAFKFPKVQFGLPRFITILRSTESREPLELQLMAPQPVSSSQPIVVVSPSPSVIQSSGSPATTLTNWSIMNQGSLRSFHADQKEV